MTGKDGTCKTDDMRGNGQENEEVIKNARMVGDENAEMIGGPLLVIVCLWEAILSHGEAKNKRLWLGLLQRRNIEQ